MEDVFYMCPKKINMNTIRTILDRNMQGSRERLEFSNEERIQIVWDEPDSVRYIEFYLFDDYLKYTDEGEDRELTLKTIHDNKIETVIGIAHHMRHIDIVLHYVSYLMREYGGILGTDNNGFCPCYLLEELQDFQYGYN